ncbi:MAG: isoprenylcysteine carboxylmethyltransferase family protein [Methanoregula sp.]
MIDLQAYGLWVLVIINSLIFIGFAYAFTRPRSSRDWKSLGAFSAFIVALFAEMYGFPLTIYLLSGWLGNIVPGASLLTHDAGHLWYTLFGMTGDPHTNWIHLLSYVFILGGLFILMSAWSVLYAARQENKLAVTGMYAYVRHPQYVAFILVMIGFLLQWPTILTMIMFPLLVWRYVTLAKQEEESVTQEFGEEYARYAAKTPGWFPRFTRNA